MRRKRKGEEEISSKEEIFLFHNDIVQKKETNQETKKDFSKH